MLSISNIPVTSTGWTRVELPGAEVGKTVELELHLLTGGEFYYATSDAADAPKARCFGSLGNLRFQHVYGAAASTPLFVKTLSGNDTLAVVVTA